MLLGNVVLVLSAVSIIRNREGFLSGADLVFWLGTGALLLARYIEGTRFGDHAAAGAAGASTFWWRYAGILVPAALGGWALAHFLPLIF
jgi:hypothetical protein